MVALIARGGNLLVLDEPTNHLDTESREALESALEAFDGTVMLVSHDRALIDAVATHTLAIEDGRAVLRAGGYGDLVRAREEAEVIPTPEPTPRRPRKRRRMSDAAPSRSPNGEVRRLEGEIARVEAGIAEVEAALADPDVLADREAVAARGEEHRALQEELAWLMREWERAAEAASG
jgi:ATP-binding cassette subfamily F protein 3